ncbi:MAG TPA: cation:proton antiporter [Thermoanaerobaculia bacterium]|nr:cation:proton antiporter [Thermoanaerobaculia bacterium]
MGALLAFAVTLVLAVLVSELTHRSVLSTAVLFLIAGFVCGNGLLGLEPIQPDSSVVTRFSELALFSVLFAEGVKIRLRDIRRNWQLPARALLIGMPLAILATALFARWTVGLGWGECLLMAAALSPTDPVLAAAIVGRQEVPHRLRSLLNLESGMNDGLALPAVLIFLALVADKEVHAEKLAGEVLLGIALGLVLAWLPIRLARTRFFQASEEYVPLGVLGIGLLILSVTSLTHGNMFLGAFAGGITVGEMSRRGRERFEEFGDLLAEILKLAGLFVFGTLISPRLLAEIGPAGYLFVLLALAAARPLALAVALLGTKMPWREWVTAAWFGPKGFASVFFALLILRTGIESAPRIYTLIAAVIAASIILHSSTDLLVVKWFEKED